MSWLNRDMVDKLSKSVKENLWIRLTEMSWLNNGDMVNKLSRDVMA